MGNSENIEAETGDAVVALLCVGDAGAHGSLALMQIYGQPFLHHLIKSLEKTGIKRFFVSIDSVPGSLLGYGDAAKKEGLDVRFVRSPGDVAAQISPETRVLVQLADMAWDQKLIKLALAEARPLVAAVEERAENQSFERIDLNHRWAGLAVLERKAFEALTELPEGWDMGSALMRRALQDDVGLWSVRQAELQDGTVRRLTNENELRLASAGVVAAAADSVNSLENMIFPSLVNRMLPVAWSAGWSRAAIEWLFPVSALGAGILAYVGIAYGAVATAILAIVVAALRKRVWQVEYRNMSKDWLGVASWLTLAAALGFLLYQGYETPFESSFLAVLTTGVSLLSKRPEYRARFWLASPLATTLFCLWGTVAGLTGAVIRLLVVVQLVLLLLPRKAKPVTTGQV